MRLRKPGMIHTRTNLDRDTDGEIQTFNTSNVSSEMRLVIRNALHKMDSFGRCDCESGPSRLENMKVCKGFLALFVEIRTCEDGCAVREMAGQKCRFKDVSWTARWIVFFFKINESRHHRVWREKDRSRSKYAEWL